MQNNTEIETTQNSSLIDRFNQQTEIKSETTPTTISNVASAPKNEHTTSFWTADDDLEPLPKPEKTTAENELPTNEKKISDTVFKNGASIVTGGLEFVTSGIIMVILKKRFKNQFTEKEYDEFLLISDKPATALTPDETKLKNRIDLANKKYEALKLKVPFTDDEEKDLEQAWFQYLKMKNIEVPPGMLVALATVSIVGKRVLDVALD
jgi:hypothetical protein